MKHMLNLHALGLVAYSGAEQWAKKSKSYSDRDNFMHSMNLERGGRGEAIRPKQSLTGRERGRIRL